MENHLTANRVQNKGLFRFLCTRGPGRRGRGKGQKLKSTKYWVRWRKSVFNLPTSSPRQEVSAEATKSGFSQRTLIERSPNGGAQAGNTVHTVHGVLKARILKWFAIPFSSGPHCVRPLHHDPPVLGGSTGHGLVSLSQTRLWSYCDQIDQFSVIMISVCLPSDALLQHLSSYLGFSYLRRRVSLHGCSSKAQPLLLTLDEGYLPRAAPPDLERGVAPLGPPV